MKKDMGTIEFENRYEIDDIMNALSKYLKEHPRAEGKQTIQELINLLDVMYMEW